MMRRFYTLFLFIAFTGILQAQTTTKLDLRLYKRLHDGKATKANISLLVRGNMDDIKALVEAYGGTYKYGYNNISSIEVPESKLIAFAENATVEKIESTGGKGVFLMDSARIRNNVDSIHAGFAPLPANLKGRNVVVGIIDGGIYWQHLDFKNPADSTTRIKYIWDQSTTAGNIPAPYNYGRQWTAADINNGTCTHTPPSSDFGHGTCVAGIAAGNSLSNKGTAYEGQFTGIAPQADIIAVRVLDGNNFLTNVVDAVDYIFKKADSLGKPCVINTSIGDYYGSHDGNDLTTHLIESLITQKNGRVLVAAAGNAGNISHHVSYPIPADSAYTLFSYYNSIGGLYFDLWADTAAFNNAYFAVGCNAPNGADSGRTAYLNVPLNFNPPQGNGVYSSQTFYSPTGVNLGLVEFYVSLDDNRYHVEVFITPTTGNTTKLWRLQTKGTGTFDLWSNAALLGSSNIVTNVNSSSPSIRMPDNLKSMVSYWQNSDKVITVGNYSNRASYVDYYGNTIDLAPAPYYETVGMRFYTSSLGPTRDNRVKPDVMATGSTTICTGDQGYINSLLSTNQGVKVSVTGKQVRNGGTSMASPIVAGVAALYLEQYPNASYSEIKQALICSATTDAFTGAVPNAQYGYGKVNAFAAIARPCVPITGIMDTSCLSFNPLANVDSGICIPKVYGVMDTACLNYNPLANVSGGTCVPKVYGVMDTACLNYNPLANVSGGTCVPKVYGVMDTACLNYNPLANVNDGVCVPKVYGVMDTACLNYNPLANVSGGTCVQKVYGVMDTACLNYNPLANVSGGACVPKVYGVMDTACLNYNPLANVNDGVCVPKVYGVMDTACLNYNPLANVSSGTCVPKVYGIMDTACLNYNPLANVSGGTCVPKVYGVMDTACVNYNPLANVSGGTCVPKVYGVMDTACLNYNPLANVSGGTCVPKVYGVMDTACLNYNPLANVSGGTCVPKVYGVMDTACLNYNPLANVSGGTCVPKVYGVMDTACLNYNPLANVSGGTCVPKVYGVMDTACLNYNPLANVSDGACVAKVYGITDTACSNYNPLANVSSGICIPLSINDLTGVLIQVVPNPFSNQTTFVIEGLNFQTARIRIFSQLGQLVDELSLTDGKNRYTYFNDKLAKGIYHYQLQADGKNVKAGKLVVQ